MCSVQIREEGKEVKLLLILSLSRRYVCSFRMPSLDSSAVAQTLFSSSRSRHRKSVLDAGISPATGEDSSPPRAEELLVFFCRRSKIRLTVWYRESRSVCTCSSLKRAARFPNIFLHCSRVSIKKSCSGLRRASVEGDLQSPQQDFGHRSSTP